MKTLHLTLAGALLLPSLAFATDLNVTVRSAGNASVTVAPGEAVPYDIRGELSDAANEGLAYFALDLSLDGGTVPPAASPTSNPMLNFDSPLGVTNPAGFGGTASGGQLLQIGGAQNTWLNAIAPVPTGNVITGVAKPGFSEVLASGTVNAPLKVGTYTLEVTNVQSNVIVQGETGVPFFHVEEAGEGSVSNLTIVVSAISADVASLSIASPSAQTLSLDAGLPHAGRTYLMLGSVTGTSPGLQVTPNVLLPLNYDFYFQFTLSNPNTPLLSNSMGVLDAQGQATTVFNLPAGLRPAVIGLNIHHAYVLLSPLNFASDAAVVTLAP